MIDLYNENKVLSIGVSNFLINDIKPLIDATGFVPMVNQIRYFVGNRQQALTEFCKENNILIEAYSPLATGVILDNPKLKEIADKYEVSLAQLCIRFCLENGTLPLPKSVHEERIIQNIDVDFKISEEDMAYLNSLDGIGPKKYLRY